MTEAKTETTKIEASLMAKGATVAEKLLGVIKRGDMVEWVNSFESFTKKSQMASVSARIEGEHSLVYGNIRHHANCTTCGMSRRELDCEECRQSLGFQCCPTCCKKCSPCTFNWTCSLCNHVNIPTFTTACCARKRDKCCGSDDCSCCENCTRELYDYRESCMLGEASTLTRFVRPKDQYCISTTSTCKSSIFRSLSKTGSVASLDEFFMDRDKKCIRVIANFPKDASLHRFRSHRNVRHLVEVELDNGATFETKNNKPYWAFPIGRNDLKIAFGVDKSATAPHALITNLFARIDNLPEEFLAITRYNVVLAIGESKDNAREIVANEPEGYSYTDQNGNCRISHTERKGCTLKSCLVSCNLHSCVRDCLTHLKNMNMSEIVDCHPRVEMEQFPGIDCIRVQLDPDPANPTHARSILAYMILAHLREWINQMKGSPQEAEFIKKGEGPYYFAEMPRKFAVDWLRDQFDYDQCMAHDLRYAELRVYPLCGMEVAQARIKMKWKTSPSSLQVELTGEYLPIEHCSYGSA